MSGEVSKVAADFRTVLDAYDTLLAKTGMLRDAAQKHIDSLDAYDSDLVPINRTRGTAGELRKALAATSQTAAPATERGTVGELQDAAQAVVDRWDTPLWKDAPATATFINRLRVVLADRQQRAHQAQGDGREPLTEVELLELMKRIDPMTKRLPPGIIKLAAGIQAHYGIVPRNQSSQESAEGGK